MSDFAPATVERTGSTSAIVHHGDDKSWLVTFYKREVEDEAATRRVGRPQYVARDYIRMESPGDKLSKWDVEVTDEHKMRFRSQWEAYQRGEEDTVEGMPLREWAQLNQSQRTVLRNAGFRTVEQVAAVTDDVISRMGHEGLILNKVKRYAQAYIDKAAEGAKERDLIEKLEQRDAKIGALEEQLRTLAGMVEDMKRGTPAQIQQAAPIVPESAPQTAVPEAEAMPDLSALADLPEPEPVVPAEPVKRRRGRPRKTPVPDA